MVLKIVTSNLCCRLLKISTALQISACHHWQMKNIQKLKLICLAEPQPAVTVWALSEQMHKIWKNVFSICCNLMFWNIETLSKYFDIWMFVKYSINIFFNLISAPWITMIWQPFHPLEMFLQTSLQYHCKYFISLSCLFFVLSTQNKCICLYEETIQVSHHSKMCDCKDQYVCLFLYPESTTGSQNYQCFTCSLIFHWRHWTLHPTPSLRSKLDPFPIYSWNICKKTLLI